MHDLRVLRHDLEGRQKAIAIEPGIDDEAAVIVGDAGPRVVVDADVEGRRRPIEVVELGRGRSGFEAVRTWAHAAFYPAVDRLDLLIFQPARAAESVARTRSVD